MDFDIIEGLTNEELLRKYENIVIQGDNNYLLAYCYCAGGLAFGMPGAGYCSLNINSDAKCRTWCANRGLSLGSYGIWCHCVYTGKEAYWGAC